MSDRVSVLPASREAHMLIRSRRSIRAYGPDRPAREVLERLFVTAAAAPSAHNRQPWRYLVIQKPELKTRLAAAMGARLAADRLGDGDPAAEVQKDVARSFARLTGAPLLVLVALTLADMDNYRDAGRSEAERVMAIQSTAMATQNLLLAAHAEGLGACWMCAPLFCPAEVEAVLGLPDGWEPQGLLTLGYPAGPGKIRERRPTSEFVAYA